MTPYRACYYLRPDRQGEILLTGPEHADLDDGTLIYEAIVQARRADILDESTDDTEEAWPRLTRKALMTGLRIGTWDTGE